MLLDASSTFAADDTLVYGVIAVPINVSNFAIFQMHFDATTASAHVTSGRFNLVPIFRRSVDLRLWEDSHGMTIAKLTNSHYGPYFYRVWSQHLAIF